jgi:hypothetical protein
VRHSCVIPALVMPVRPCLADFRDPGRTARYRTQPLGEKRMPKRNIRDLTVAGATMVSATVLIALASGGPSATAMPVPAAGHVGAAARAANPPGKFLMNGDGLCLGIQGGRDLAPAVQWKCESTYNQLWYPGLMNGAGAVEIKNEDNQCLGVEDGDANEGEIVYGWTCITSHPDQYWYVIVSDGAETIENYKNRNLYLSVDGCNNTGGDFINVWGWAGRTCQLWAWPYST